MENCFIYLVSICAFIASDSLSLANWKLKMTEFSRLNPMTGEVASSAPAMRAADIPAIAGMAQAGFAVWSKMGPNARRAVLMKAADALMGKKDDFVHAMMNEIGATAGWAMFNLGLAAGMVREAASSPRRLPAK